MSQDIRSSKKTAYQHVSSKPARSSTVKQEDPNAKSRVLDAGPSPTADTEPPPNQETTILVKIDLPASTYDALDAWARSQGTSVAEIFRAYADDILLAQGLCASGPSDETESPV